MSAPLTELSTLVYLSTYPQESGFKAEETSIHTSLRTLAFPKCPHREETENDVRVDFVVGVSSGFIEGFQAATSRKKSTSYCAAEIDSYLTDPDL